MKPSDSPGRPRSVTTRTRCIGIRIAPRHKLRHWASQSRQCLTSNVLYLFIYSGFALCEAALGVSHCDYIIKVQLRM